MGYLKKVLLSLICFIFIICIAQDCGKKQETYIKSVDDNCKLYNDNIKNKIIYEHGWDNPSVDCYKDIEIPLTAKIDVSRFTMPVNGKVISEFGYRSKFKRKHYGVDLKLKTGDTVRAAFDGIVRLVNFEKDGYGKYIVLRHNNGMETVYAHLSKHLVKREQTIKAGQPIGLGGNTGKSFGTHLHFEIRYFGVPLNPSTIVDFKEGVIHQNIYIFNKKERKL